MTPLLRAATFACLLLAGCASARMDEPVTPREITLLPGADAALSRTVSLRFDSVADSRCPSNVKCVWAGVVAYHFTLTSLKGAEAFRLESGGAFLSARLQGVRIHLSAPSPGPLQMLGVEPPPHPVTLGITRF